MAYDFNSVKEGKWFFYVPTEEDAGVKLRFLTTEKAEEIYKCTTKKTVDVVVKNRLFQKRIGDDEASFARLVDYTIEDWTGTLLDGEELECTAPNKVKLLRKSPAFRKFYDDKMEELEKENEDLEAKRLKNLEEPSEGS